MICSVHFCLTRRLSGISCPLSQAQLRASLLFQECQLSAKSGAPALKGPGVGVVLPGHLCPRSRCSSSELSLSSTCSEYSSGSSCTWHDGKNLRKRVRPPFKAHRHQSEPESNLLEGRWEGGLRRSDHFSECLLIYSSQKLCREIMVSPL